MSRAPAELETELEALHAASFGWALSCCRWDAEEAEEVLQTSYLKVLEGRARFAQRSTVKTWLFGVIRRTAAERRRRRWVRELAFGRWRAARPVPAPHPNPERLADRSREAAALRAALAALPRRQREIVSLVFYQELTLEEAAAVAGISLGSARTHYHRGKLALRRRLTEERRP